MLKKILYVALLVVFAGGGYLIGLPSMPDKVDVFGFSNPVPVVNTVSSVTLAVSTTTVLSANQNRQYALIMNDSDTVIYLHLNAPTTTNALNEGIRLNASGGSYEISRDNLYTGAISATSTAASKVLTTIEW